MNVGMACKNSTYRKITIILLGLAVTVLKRSVKATPMKVFLAIYACKDIFSFLMSFSTSSIFLFLRFVGISGPYFMVDYVLETSKDDPKHEEGSKSKSSQIVGHINSMQPPSS